MGLTPINQTGSVVSKEIGAINLTGRAINTVTESVSAVASRGANAIGKVFGGFGKVLKKGALITGLGLATLANPIAGAAIYTTLATGKIVKNKVEGKSRGESIGDGITKPLGSGIVAKHTDFQTVGEGLKDMTIGAGGEILKGGVEAVTVPLMGAKFADSNTSSTTSSQNGGSDSASSTASDSTGGHTVDAPSTPKTDSAKEQRETQKEAKKREADEKKEQEKITKQEEKDKKKAEADEKKQEEKEKKDKLKEESDAVQKKADQYNKTVDKIIPKLTVIKNDVSTERESDKKQELLDQEDEKIANFENIMNEFNTLQRTVKGHGSLHTRNAIDNPEHLHTDIITMQEFIKDKMISEEGGYDKYDDIAFGKRSSKNLQTLLRHLDQYANTIEEEFYTDPDRAVVGGGWTNDQKGSLLGVQKLLDENMGAIEKSLDNQENTLNKQRKKISDIKPSTLEKQEDNIIEGIEKVSTLMAESKSKVTKSSGGFLSGKTLSINDEYIEDLSADLNEAMEQLSSHIAGSEGGIHRKDIDRKVAPLLSQAQSNLQSLAA